MSDALQQMRKAQEDRFFKLEQEKDLMAYVKKLKATGRYDQIPTPVVREANLSATALPQIMAHSTRLTRPMEAEVIRRQVDRSFMTRHIIKGVCTGDPHLVGSLTLGSRVSLGKNKWTATGGENMNIFSVGEAAQVISKAPKHLDGVESRAARHMVDTSFVEIGGTRLKLMPDPTPGRAMAWGGTLAVWGTAAIVVGTCKVMNIQSMEDLKRVMNHNLTPLGEAIKSTMDPMRAFLSSVGGGEGAASVATNTRNSDFSKGVRRVFQ